ncbi:U32 family peptidase [Clostridium sp. AF32-12BH]|uniref:U32 family peptidase n=1 Tax=Clostridium sp. AF32-12BH TaxID=2292006 RepID=UPI00325BA624
MASEMDGWNPMKACLQEAEREQSSGEMKDHRKENQETENRMKIVAGLGSIEEYIRFCEAGADEFFAGYVPYEWNRKYGTLMSLNRREVFCSNVQLGAFSELEILAAMVQKYKRPVHLTFNALYYLPEQYPEIARIIKNCMRLGYRTFIVADPALILYLREHQIDCQIHLSGETGEVNSRMLSAFQEYQIQRLIFHRKNSFSDMESVIQHGKQDGKTLEYEAFVLNELCQFSGAFCNSLHCDEMGYLCRVPYRLGPIRPGNMSINTVETEKRDGMERCDSEEAYGEDGYLCGATGCGLCALDQLQKAGITHLKLVGRGNYVDFMERDIRNLKRVLDILQESAGSACKTNMKTELFPHGCSGNCYYRESAT